MIAVEERHHDTVEAHLVQALNCVPDRSALASATVAEHMRASLYGANAVRRSPVPTVHTTRLMINARRVAELTWPSLCGPGSEPSDVCDATLRNMESLGDAVDIGHGHWLATPLRLVAPSTASQYLLLGAAPAPAAKNVLKTTVTCAGASRFVGSQCLNISENRDFVQSIDAWLGDAQPLQLWTAQVLASHEARMEETRGMSADQLELYAPDILRRQRRTGRWLPAVDVDGALDGVRLARPRGAFAREYDRPYCLVHLGFKDGAPSLLRSASIAHGLTLRLRFGLDALLNTPRRTSIVMSAQTFAIDKPGALPEAESRVYALGWRDYASPEPTDRLTFHAYALPFVVHALQRLCITPTSAQRSSL